MEKVKSKNEIIKELKAKIKSLEAKIKKIEKAPYKKKPIKKEVK